jgi:hypothetical protein
MRNKRLTSVFSGFLRWQNKKRSKNTTPQSTVRKMQTKGSQRVIQGRKQKTNKKKT